MLKAEHDIVRIKVFGGQLLVLAQLATYVMAAIRWFSTEHDTFWFGFKELVWALCPLVNFTYVWDWWLAFLVIVFSLLQAAADWLVGWPPE